LRKLFWRIYTKLRLWYLYHNKDLPWSESPDYTKCPTCNWDTARADFYDKSFLGTSDFHRGYESAEYWTEHWKCPRCGTKFKIETGN
jgi:rubredoxin